MNFDHEYEANRQRWIEPDEQVVAWLKDIPAGRALDLGSGEGGNSFWLARQGWEVTSIDAAPSAVKFIESHSREHGYRIDAQVADVRHCLEEETYDMILLSYVHFSEEERVTLFKERYQQLAEGGVLIYLGLIKSEEELPPGGRLEEFPCSEKVVREMPAEPDLVVLEQEDRNRELPIGIVEGMYQARTAAVKIGKGRS
ncbi:class I SAM-dependent methyltransferase [Salimicrobium sp. PL1-032A]|uniref:class I SAM-dependent methyltransferase n=1 Tax=Salimicrobium sp. PL1-032A TaxID=3095364 RepID=UPI0032607F9B